MPGGKTGLFGLPPTAQDSVARLLVTDDHAHGALAAMLPDVRTGMIRVFAPAVRCAQLITDRLGWRSDRVTAMVCRDLRALPELRLPDSLTVRPVQRSFDDRQGVPLMDTVTAVMAADPDIKGPRDRFAQFLRSLPATFRLFAAVDEAGTVRATAGSGVFGEYANVIFVNTDPRWRNRGIGQAMTTHALSDAQRAGARRACLDASAAGLSIYLRLGFETAATLTRFFGPR